MSGRKPIVKTPITYYGGKQMMLPHILPLIPEHTIYTEAFAGGLAVFFAKEPSKIEVINDVNGEIVNFYRIMKNEPEALDELVQATLHSRQDHRDALVMYSNPHLFTEVQRAWAFWVRSTQSFSGVLTSGWAYA